MRLLPSGFTPLHGLRILAFLAVFQIRTSGQLYWRGLLGSTWWSVYSATSIYGMDFFFFFLSGFLIGTMLLANPPAGPGDLGRFYARRQFRILPPYFVVLLLLSLARGAWPWPQEMLFLTNYPSNRSYLMVWSWSLSVEEHFYLIAPRLFVLVFRALPRPDSCAAGGIWLSGGFVRACLISDPVVQYHATHGRYDILAAGMLMAVTVHFGQTRLIELMTRYRWLAYACLGGCLLILVIRALSSRLA